MPDRETEARGLLRRIPQVDRILGSAELEPLLDHPRATVREGAATVVGIVAERNWGNEAEAIAEVQPLLMALARRDRVVRVQVDAEGTTVRERTFSMSHRYTFCYELQLLLERAGVRITSRTVAVGTVEAA